MSSPALRGLSLAAAALFAATLAHAQTWDFTSDAQGWSVKDYDSSAPYNTLLNTYAPVHVGAGGNPGGFIRAADPSSGTFLFQSPTGLGNYSAYNGGSLSFSLATDLGVTWFGDSVVMLRGAGFSALAAIDPLPEVSWTQVTLTLTAADFFHNSLAGAAFSETDFAALLGSLDTLSISGEFYNGVNETSALDSVAFALPGGATPVPEPSTYGLLGACALSGLVAWRRRRRNVKA